MYASLTAAYLAIAGLLKLAHEDYRPAKRSENRSCKISAKVKANWPKFKSGIRRSFELMGQVPLQ